MSMKQKRTLNQKEINLIFILCILMTAYLSTFIYEKQVSSGKHLEVKHNETIKDIKALSEDLKNIPIIENEIDIIRASVESRVGNFLTPSSLRQEDIVKLLNKLVRTNELKIKKISFNSIYVNEPELNASVENNRIEKIPRISIDKTNNDSIIIIENTNIYDTINLNLRIEFESDYESLVDFVKRTNELNTSIYIKSIEFKTNLPESKSNITEAEVIEKSSLAQGVMVIVFTYVPIIEEYGYKKLFNFEYDEKETQDKTPFIPYSEFVNSLIDHSKIIELEEFEYIDEISIKDNNDEKKRRTLYKVVNAFEEMDYFFVGNSVDVKGSTSTNERSAVGNKSAQMTYEFMNGTEKNIANLVFDKNILLLSSQVEEISLKVFSNEYSYHSVGLVIIDSSGKQFKVNLTEGVYWTGWQELTSTLSPEINYPCVVSRIYIDDNGEKSKLSGTLLFDDLRVLYTKDLHKGE